MVFSSPHRKHCSFCLLYFEHTILFLFPLLFLISQFVIPVSGSLSWIGFELLVWRSDLRLRWENCALVCYPKPLTSADETYAWIILAVALVVGCVIDALRMRVHFWMLFFCDEDLVPREGLAAESVEASCCPLHSSTRLMVELSIVAFCVYCCRLQPYASHQPVVYPCICMAAPKSIQSLHEGSRFAHPWNHTYFFLTLNPHHIPI